MSSHDGNRMNRNGAVGEFERYAPPEMTLEEILEDALRRRSDPPGPAARVSTGLMEREGCRLVRYHLGSPELEADQDAVIGTDRRGHSAGPDHAAVFGVIGPDDAPLVLFEVLKDRARGPSIFMAWRAPDAVIPDGVVHAFLNHLDIPASYSAGADSTIRDMFDLAWRGEEGWKAVEPVHVVVVSYERVCFSVRPVMRERVDVMVPPHPSHDLASPDRDHVYWARHFYKGIGWSRMEKAATGVRPGFSSWMPVGEPALAKVVGDGLESELAAIMPPSEPSAAPAPRRR